MQVTGVNYSKTIQAAQYEPETVEVNVVLGEGEDFETVVKELREKVARSLGRAAAARTSITNNATAATASTGTKAEESSGENVEKITKKADLDAQKKADAAAKKKTTAEKKKVVKYDRTVPTHQTAMGKVLAEHFPGWKDDAELKVKAKPLSESLVGTDFMDGAGKVFDSFVEACKKGMMGGEEESNGL